jgi:hypothetical protein
MQISEEPETFIVVFGCNLETISAVSGKIVLVLVATEFELLLYPDEFSAVISLLV